MSMQESFIILDQRMAFYCGTSGLQITIPKRDFPPEHEHKSRLEYYAVHENSIEINSSFYRLPQAVTVNKWAQIVPEGFRFTFKLWKEITHQKNLIFDPAAVDRFMNAISGCEKRKGCLLVQFPPGLQVSALHQLNGLLQLLSAYQWPVAVEFRHRSWYEENVYELLTGYNAAMVIQDMPASATPLINTADNLIYLRFHGPDGRYKGSYSEELLYEYASYIKEWEQEGKTVYAYFNNTAGDALKNLQFLKKCLE